MNPTTFSVVVVAMCVTVLQAIAIYKGLDGKVLSITIGILAFLAGLLCPQMVVKLKGWGIELAWQRGNTNENPNSNDKEGMDIDGGKQSAQKAD